ncbi:MAG: hypothetical protein E7517_00290 [Ruminococcaceae bacterium]|nr:hypothetical protein [Oscillospiraceae bacterium]
MKKTVAIIISVLLIISLLPMAAFAGEKSDEVKAKMEAARDYLYGEKTEFTAAESLDFLLYLLAGGDGADFKDAYIQSVKDAFEAGSMNTADRIALAGLCLKELDVDVNAFELNDHSKIDLEQKIVDAGLTADSPYNYFFVIAFAEDSTYLEQIQEELKANYTQGSGYDYWGFGSDNSANFAAMSTDDELVADAVNVVEKAKTDKGYYYLAEYGTDANGNSTASALFMYSILENQDKADEVYALLVDNFTAENGGFAYALGGTADNYATRDALKALIYYNIISQDEPQPETTTSSEDATTQATTAADSSAQQSTPATGDSFAACGIAAVAVLALGVVVATRKKTK